jgi:hypothetical protein
VFVGWDTRLKDYKAIPGHGCMIILNTPGKRKFEIAPQFRVEKISKAERTRQNLKTISEMLNPQGVSTALVFDPRMYTDGYNPPELPKNYIQFTDPLGGGIRIHLWTLYDGDGFSIDAFSQEVIKSFYFVTPFADTLTPSLTPASVGAIHVTEPDLFPKAYRSVIEVVTSELKKDQEDPSEFYAQIESKTNSEILVIHLWHQAAFKPGAESMHGNPGGKCRDFYYDTKQERVTKKLWWQ